MAPKGGRDVGRYLVALSNQLTAQAPLVLEGAPDATHQMRITTRRALACLAAFGPTLGLADTGPMREELRWLAQVLGDFRDAEVTAARLPGEHALPERVQKTLADALDRARLALSAALESERFAALAAALAGQGEAARPRPRHADLTRAVRRQWRRASARHAAYLHSSGEQDRDRALHDVRRASRRLRYACEAVGTAGGKDVPSAASAAKEVQEVLGEHQDAVVSLALLRGLAGSERDAARAASYAVLFDVETAARDRARARFEHLWPELVARFSRH